MSLTPADIGVPARAAPQASTRSALGRLWRRPLLRSLLKAALTIYVVATLTFFLLRLLPGSPVDVEITNLMQQGYSYEEARDAASALFNIDLDAPLPLQYLEYLGRITRGDLGTSLLSQGQPVIAIILRYLPWTLFAAGTGLIISFTLGILLGIVAAYRRGSALDAFLSSTATIIHAIPGFLLGIMIVIFLGVQARLIPITQMRGSLSPGVQPGLTLEFVGDALFHAALPISVYVLETYGTWLLSMKGSAVAALEEDYVAAARARGLTDGRIATAYVGRNAVLPLFAQLSIAVGYIVGGSVIIETIFVYQGVGALLNDRLARRDYPVIQGIVLLITIAVVLANLLADYVYARLDPRIGRARGGS